MGETRSYLALSIATAFVARIGGLFISSRLLVPSGGAAVLTISTFFFVRRLGDPNARHRRPQVRRLPACRDPIRSISLKRTRRAPR